MKFILLLLLSSPILALQPHIATYSLSIAGFEIATEQRVLSKKNGVYRYVESAQTTGFAKMLKDYQINAQSTFIINETNLYSTRYKIFERDGNTIKKNIDIVLKDQQIDPLSLVLALAHALEKNPKQVNFYFSVNDGKDIEQHHYQRVDSEDANLIKIINPKKHIVAYFAKDKNYLPVHIKRKKFNYRLLTLQ